MLLGAAEPAVRADAFLVWKHVSSEQLQALRQHGERAAAAEDADSGIDGAGAAARRSGGEAPTGWAALRQLAGAGDASGEAGGSLTPEQEEVMIELCGGALAQGEAWGFSDEKLSALLGIVKETHARAARERLPVEAAFRFFRDALLRHSVQRPPFSIGVFSAAEVGLVLRWGIDAYFRHYKLYQYAFTARVTLDVCTRHPAALLEAPPPLPALRTAATEDEHTTQLEAQRRQREAAEAAAAAAAAAAAEAERARALEAEYAASLPEDVQERVARAVERELAGIRGEMDREFRARHAGLLSRLAALEGARAAPQP
ncbi:hypothetical protein Rsub_08842 [Raphidocelis subcapitata]|uniref:Flagellar associated protein n=1 Tax=Raphidocelis subcapitata TaxID=307507 RepID=A0A2V0PFP5_9CHLO|nr:hypothetical protein Rsub_08842 [Raphidocelis subcapitata]|eukprot:GBF96027.1 hypothetical protein Rsub_08842 [Raphidocelis subcapitata]